MMRCESCGYENNDTAKFCRFCGEEFEAEPDRILPPKSKKIYVIIPAIVIVMVVAVVVASIYMANRNDASAMELSADVTDIELQDSYTLENDGLDLKSPKITYADGKTEKLKKYTAYVNGEKCKMKNGQICIPDKPAGDSCKLRIEWEKGGKSQFCEKTVAVISEKETTESEPAETTVQTEPEDPFETAKAELTDRYGEAEAVQGDGSSECPSEDQKYFITNGVIGFYNMDMDQDGEDEMLCIYSYEEDEISYLDCAVYQMKKGQAQQLFSMNDTGDAIAAGSGEIIIRDGEIPHIANVNRGTPYSLYEMKDGEIVKTEVELPEGHEDMVGAEMYARICENYDEYIGGQENYNIIEDIDGSDFYFHTRSR